MTPTLKLLYDRCEDDGNCRVWTQATSRGVPVISLSAKLTGVRVRPLAWSLAHDKPVPKGLFVYSACGNRLCISAHCLRCGTKAQYAHNAAKFGAYHNPLAIAKRTRTLRTTGKLDWEKVRALRADRAAGKSMRDLATAYGISISLASKVANGHRWRETLTAASIFNRK